MKIFLILLVGLIFAGIVYFFVSVNINFAQLRNVESKGKRGEEHVANVLAGLDGKTLNNYIILDSFGKSHQIDHIFVSSRGVFVIETKNYSGLIFGTQNQNQWTQMLGYGKTVNRFYNPVKQNETHVKMVEGILRFKYIPIYSCVVFVDGDLERVEADDVFPLDELQSFIEEKPVKLDASQVDMIYNKLERKRAKDITDEEHADSVRSTLQNIENNICPRCGGQLVKREGSYGEFYGCSNYPRCKFTKRAEEDIDKP